MTIAKTIYNQIEGNKVNLMLGVKNFMGGENNLSFTFKAKAKDGINNVNIILNSSDLYNVEFNKIRGLNFKQIKVLIDLPVENLVYAIERNLQLNLSL